MRQREDSNLLDGKSVFNEKKRYIRQKRMKKSNTTHHLEKRVKSLQTQLKSLKNKQCIISGTQSQSDYSKTNTTIALEITPIGMDDQCNETLLKQNRFFQVVNDNDDENMNNNSDDDFMEVLFNKNNTRTIINNNCNNNKSNMEINNTQKSDNVNVHRNINNSNTNKSSSNKLVNKTVKPPPINVYNQNTNESIMLLEKHDIKDFNIQRVNKNKHRIQTESLDSFKKAKELLNKVAAPYYSYVPKSEKLKCMLLKGLSNTEDINFLTEELKTYEEENLKIVHIQQFSTSFSKKNGKTLPIYLVQISTDSHISKLTAIRYLHYHRISWDKLSGRDVVPQCKNCQRFGHTASNCNLRYRCVKCIEEHEPGKCSVVNINVAAYCINCKEVGHPASYRGCKIYQELLKKIKIIKESKRNNSTVNHNSNLFQSFVQPNVSFAQACTNNAGDKVKSLTEPNPMLTNTRNSAIEQLQLRIEKFENFMINTSKNLQVIMTALDSLMEKVPK